MHDSRPTFTPARRCQVTVLGKLFTPVVPLSTKQRNCICQLTGVDMRPLSRRRPITGRLGTRHLSNTPFQIRTYLINLKQRENCARFVIYSTYNKSDRKITNVRCISAVTHDERFKTRATTPTRHRCTTDQHYTNARHTGQYRKAQKAKE